MTTKVEKSVLVNVPVNVAYNQWTQFEDFPQFMGGITSVTQLSDDRLEWVAEIGGVRRRWEAKILEQVPDRKVSWAATEGATNAGEVTFENLQGRTSVHLSLEYEPEGLVEKVGDKLNVVENQAEGDLERFKAFIESESYASGSWRGSINGGGGTVGSPDAGDAAASRGDSGKAGVSGKAVAAGLGAAAAAAAGIAAVAASSSKSSQPTPPAATTETVPPVDTSTVPHNVADADATPPHVVSYEEVEAITDANEHRRGDDTSV